MESWAGQLSVAVVGRVRPGVALRPGRARGEAGAAGLLPTGLSGVTAQVLSTGTPRWCPLSMLSIEDLESSFTCWCAGPAPCCTGAVRPSGGHSLHGRTQPHASTSGHGHTSAAPPHASMLSQGGEEATGFKLVLDAGPSGSPGQGSRLLPAQGLACSIFTGGWGQDCRAGADPQQKSLDHGTLSSPRVVPGGNPRRGNAESPWTRDAASLPPVYWADHGTAEGIDALPKARGSLGHP